jgi:hypothetical protein
VFAYLVLLVYRAHQGSGWRQDLVDEDEDGLFGRQLDPLANNVDELADGEVGGDKVLLLVDGGDIRLFDLFADDLDGVSGVLGMGGGREWRTGMRSAYFWRMRSASALRFSKGCSSLNLECMFASGMLGVKGWCRSREVEERWWKKVEGAADGGEADYKGAGGC